MAVELRTYDPGVVRSLSAQADHRDSDESGRILEDEEIQTRLHSVIELHDSTVAAVAQVGAQVIVFFSHAYVHKSEGSPAQDAGSGWIQAAALIFDEGTIEGETAEWPADIWSGHLMVEGEVHKNLIPIPFHHSGNISLKMQVDTPAKIVVRGNQALLTLIGEAFYVEEFPGEETERGQP